MRWLLALWRDWWAGLGPVARTPGIHLPAAPVKETAMQHIVALALLLLPALVWAAGPVRDPAQARIVEWVAPTTNEDGSPLTDLAQYRLFWSQDPSTVMTKMADLIVTSPSASPAPNTLIQATIPPVGSPSWITASKT